MPNILPIDTPICSRCHRKRENNELNGYDPTAPLGRRYRTAYCRRVAECQSARSHKTLDKIVSQLPDSPVDS